MAKSHAHAEDFWSVLRLFALFGHPVRVVIFQRLARAPMAASELAHSGSDTTCDALDPISRTESRDLATDGYGIPHRSASAICRRLIQAMVNPSGLPPARD